MIARDVKMESCKLKLHNNIGGYKIKFITLDKVSHYQWDGPYYHLYYENKSKLVDGVLTHGNIIIDNNVIYLVNGKN